MRTCLVVITLLALLTSGCVLVDHEHPHRSWPKAVQTDDLRQFEGVYRNHSLDAKTGEASEHGSELFDFITGPGHAHGSQGKRVELRLSQEGDLLSAGLFDEDNRQIDSAKLWRGKNFALSDGALLVYDPFSGWHGRSGNLGSCEQYYRFNLRRASGGGILGHTSEAEVSHLFYLIPVVETSGEWMFWPKISK
jgi:hypothetical protein